MYSQTHNRAARDQNVITANRRHIKRVPLVVVVETPPYIAPNMAQDAHVIIDRPELIPQGLRLGDWSQIGETK